MLSTTPVREGTTAVQGRRGAGPLRDRRLVVLLPATWLVLSGGLLGTLASVTLAGGGIASIPGLFLLGLAQSTHWTSAMLLTAGILTVQAFASRWWLRRFRYGPLEWAMRSVTWWDAVPNRRR